MNNDIKKELELDFPEIDAVKLGKRIEKLIKRRGLSKKALAQLIGVTANNMTSICKGEYKSESGLPKLQTIVYITIALKVDFYELLGLPNPTEMARRLKRYEELTKEIKQTLGGYKDILECKLAHTVSFKLADNMRHYEDHYLRVSCRFDYLGQEGIYPQRKDEDAKMILEAFCDTKIVVQDYYDVYNGNLYLWREDKHIPFHQGIDVPVYEYVNEHGDIDKLEKIYNKKRYCLGIIGALDANEFFWLNYLIGYFDSVTDEFYKIAEQR